MICIISFTQIKFTNVYPQNNQENISPTSLILKWQIDSTKKLIYDLYLGESKTPPLFNANIPSNIYPIKILKPSTTYYWKIVAKDENENYESPVWSFKTRNFRDGELIWVSFVENSDKIVYQNNLVFNIYKNTIEAYNNTKDLAYKIVEEFSDFSITSNYIYLLQKNEIKLYNLINGRYDKSIQIDQEYTHIKIANDYIFLYTENSIDIYSNSNKILNLKLNEHIENIFPFKNAFIIDLKNKILILDYSGKTLKNFKISANIFDLNNQYILLSISNSLYLLSYSNQMIKLDNEVKNAILDNNIVYIIKDKKIIIYDIQTKKRKTIDTNFDFSSIIFSKNSLILIGKKIYSVDFDGNILWKHEFQNDNITSNVELTDYNTLVFSLDDGKYKKIAEIYSSNLKRKKFIFDQFILFENTIPIETPKNTKISTLPTPVIIKPKSNEIIQDFNTSLEWILPDYESTTVTYEIQLKEISNGLIKSKKITNLKNNKILLSLEPNTKYIWKVIAYDKKQTKESVWYSFSTSNLEYVLKRIKLVKNQMPLKSLMKNNILYFTGYTVTPENDKLKLLYGNISNNFSNLKAWTFGNSQDKYGTSIDITDDGTVLIGGFSAEKDSRGDFMISSLSEDGKINWNIISGNTKRDSINDIYFDDSEEYIYTIGTTGTDNMGSNILFSKYSPKGYRIWSREFGGYELEFAKTLKRINKYSFLLLGSTNSFGEGGYDYYIVKTNELGKKLWDLTIGTSKDDFASDLIMLSKKEFIILGTSFRDTLQPFIAKFDENGFKILEKIIPLANDVNLIKGTLFNNYIYSVGWYREKNDLKRKGVIIKFDLNGNLIYTKIFDIDNQDTVFTDLIINNNKFYLIGFSEYPEPNSRDIILIQTTEDYIQNNFKNAD